MLQVHNDGQQQRCHNDFVNFFVCNIKKHIACCISAKKNYCNLTKNSHKFQASVSKRSRIFWQSPSKVPAKKLSLLKNFTILERLQKWFLRFPVRFFWSVYRCLFVSYTADTLCIRIHICKRYFFPLLLFLRHRAKEN